MKKKVDPVGWWEHRRWYITTLIPKKNKKYKMRPYCYRRLTTRGPDIGDIQDEGRPSSVGKLYRKSGDYNPYVKSRARRRIRRWLKRQDKQRALRIIKKELNYDD